MNVEDDFFIPISKNTKTPTSMKLSELKKLRADTFDRWAWDTGSDEDKVLFEKLDNILKNLDNSMGAGYIHAPYIPIYVSDVDNDDET